MKIGGVAALLISLGMPAWALIPGAWEPFTTETNTLAWGLEDFGDPEEIYAPTWVDEENPYAESFMIGDGISIFADDLVGEGAFIGDFAATEVESIELYVYLDDPTRLDYLEFFIRNASGRYYYSMDVLGTEFSEPGWYLMEFWLDEVWFYWDGGWKEQVLTPEILADVIEIGINFYPVEENEVEVFVGIDDVSLKHRLYPAALAADVVGDMIELSFPTEPAHWYVLEEYDEGAGTWEVVDGQDLIFGPEPYLYAFPAGDGDLYRAVADHDYVEVVTPPEVGGE